jgi:hypothetical protein
MPTRSNKALERYALRRITEDAVLNRAFQLTHSIYNYRERDRKTALEILSSALSGVEVRLVSQDEADRHDPQKPSKVRWSTLQWLQLLIYIKSEEYEKQQEVNSPTLLSESDLVIRYIKHLILITSRRNSFYVTLGLSRLLYDYSTTDAMGIYHLVFQDPDISTKKSDAYYRDRKIKLMSELQKRFHHFVKIYQGVRGENRFQTVEDSAQFANLVKRCLACFTPWQTACVLPEHLSEWDTVPALQSNQVTQVHSVIHPPCFSRVVETLKLTFPLRRLAVPKFFMSHTGEGKLPPGETPEPSELNKKEVAKIRKRLANESSRRKTFSPQSISVLVDGGERARLDPAGSACIRLRVEPEAALIEFVGHDKQGELLLGTHILISDDDRAEDQSETYSVALAGGQKISLEILSRQNGIDSDEVTIVNIQYLQAEQAGAAEFWRHVGHRASQWFAARSRWRVVPLTIALAATLSVVIAGVLYFSLRNRPAAPPQIARQDQPPSIAEQVRPGPTAAPGPTAPPKPSAARAGAEATPAPREQGSGVTREQSVSEVKSLLNVKRVYFKSFGEGSFAQSARQAFIERLRTTQRFVVTDDPEDADTAVSGKVTQETSRIGQVTVELINPAGEVVWRARKYRGSTEQVAAKFSRDLLEAVRRQENASRSNR